MERGKESMGKHYPGQRYGILTGATNKCGNGNENNNAILAVVNGSAPYQIR